MPQKELNKKKTLPKVKSLPPRLRFVLAKRWGSRRDPFKRALRGLYTNLKSLESTVWSSEWTIRPPAKSPTNVQWEQRFVNTELDTS